MSETPLPFSSESVIKLEINGVPIHISVTSSTLVELFLDYFRYYNPVLSQDTATDAGQVDIELRLAAELPSRDDLIPSDARLVSQTGVIELWQEGDYDLRHGDLGRFYFDAGTAAFGVDTYAGRIVGLITPGALEYPHILANTYTLFPILLMLRARGIFHLHAAAVISPDDKLWLICGSQRAGKTTLTTALGLSGWAPISDDSLLIGTKGLTPLKKYFHIGEELIERWAGLNEIDIRHRYLDRACVRGLEFFKTFEAAERIFKKVDYILLPQITTEPASSIEPIAGSEALLKLAEQSVFFQLWRGHLEMQWILLGEMVRDAECFRLRGGADILDDPANASRLLSNVGSIEGI